MICRACGSPLYHRNDDVGGTIAIDLLSLAAEVSHAPDLGTAQSLGHSMLAIGAAALADKAHEHPSVSQNGDSVPLFPDPHWVEYACTSCEAIQKGLPGHVGEECPSCEVGTLQLIPDRVMEEAST